MDDYLKRMDALRSLAARLGVEVDDYSLLDRALTHASVLSDASDASHDYESLEFVGDAVLGLAVAHYLYEQQPDRGPGDYTKMRSWVVNRRTLARRAAELDIGSAVRLGKGEERAGGRKRSALLADCMEAIIGALYLDQGWDAAKVFVGRVFEAELREAQSATKIWDFRSKLQIYCQSKRLALPEFVVVRALGPDHNKEFEVEVSLRGEVVGSGKGTTKKEAEQEAARTALEREGQLDN